MGKKKGKKPSRFLLVAQLCHVLAQGSPIFHSSFKGELGIVHKSLQGKIDLPTTLSAKGKGEEVGKTET